MAPKTDTRQRVLDAAEKAFARAGWQGATTREVARLAKVNEVTLFRHFKTKKLLFEAMVRRFLESRQRIVTQALAEDAPLEAVLLRYAEDYDQSTPHSDELMRTFLAEFSRHPTPLREVVRDVAGPLKAGLGLLLKRAQERNDIRADVNLDAALELFTGMLLARKIKPCLDTPSFTKETYRLLCVGVFLRGLRP